MDQFLKQHHWHNAKKHPPMADAAARIYTRLEKPTGETILLMDMHKIKESLPSFIAISQLLNNLDLSAPKIIASDLENGLALVEDFGDRVFFNLLANGENAEDLYQRAVDILIHLHRQPIDLYADLPATNWETWLNRMDRFWDDYLPAHNIALPASARQSWNEAWAQILPAAQKTIHSICLWDYHAGNLMDLPDRKNLQQTGLLDFQDAHIAPVMFDLASLLEDARRDIPADLRQTLITHYQNAFPEMDPAALDYSYTVLATARHFRVLGTFAHLAKHGKPSYQHHNDRVWHYIKTHLEQPALDPVKQWMEQNMPNNRKFAS